MLEIKATIKFNIILMFSGVSVKISEFYLVVVQVFMKYLCGEDIPFCLFIQDFSFKLVLDKINIK